MKWGMSDSPVLWILASVLRGCMVGRGGALFLDAFVKNLPADLGLSCLLLLFWAVVVGLRIKTSCFF